MAQSLKALLNKPHKTGRDIGLILMYYVKAILEQKEFPITKEEFSELLLYKDYRADKWKFDTLDAYYKAITAERHETYENARRVAGGTSLLRLYLRSFDEHNKQDALRYSLPLTLTSYGYDSYKIATKKAAEKKAYTFYEVFAAYLFYYLRQYSKNPLLIPNEIYNNIVLLEGEKITAKAIKEQYQRTHFDSYILDAEHPNGVNFDTKEAIDILAKIRPATNHQKEQIAETIRTIDKAYFNNELESVKDDIAGLSTAVTKGDIDIQNMDGEELREFYRDLTDKIENYNITPTQFKIILKERAMPANTTVYALLSEALDKFDKDKNGEPGTPTGLLFADDQRTPAKQLREFKAAAPALYELLCENIRAEIPYFAEFDNADIFKAAIKGEELKALKVDAMRDKFDLDKITLEDMKNYIINSKDTSHLEKRQAKNGIAVFSLMEKAHLPPTTGRVTIAGAGAGKPKIYNPPMPEPGTSMKAIEETDTEVIYQKEVCEPYAFIEICNKGLKVEFMRCAEFKEMAFVLMNIHLLNKEIYATYRKIKGDKKTRAERERIFKTKFKPIDPYSMEITQEMKDLTAQALDAVIKNKVAAQLLEKSSNIIKAAPIQRDAV